MTLQTALAQVGAVLIVGAIVALVVGAILRDGADHQERGRRARLQGAALVIAGLVLALGGMASLIAAALVGVEA